MEKSESIKELAVALCMAQAEVANAKKDSTNPFFNSRYADLATVIDTIKPVFTRNGLSFLQMPGYEGNYLTVTTMILHSSGEYVSEVAKVIPVKTEPQAIGSAITYLRRYALAAFAGIAQEDDDANSHQGSGVTQYIDTQQRSAAPVTPAAQAYQKAVASGGSFRVRIAPRATDFDAVKEQLKAAGYRWNQETKEWVGNVAVPSAAKYYTQTPEGFENQASIPLEKETSGSVSFDEDSIPF